MERFTDLEVVIVVVLGIKKASTIEGLSSITGAAKPTLYRALSKLKKRGLIRSNPLWKHSFLGLPMPNKPPTRGKCAIYVLNVELEQLWQNPEFRQQASHLFETSELSEVKSTILKLNKNC